MPWRAESYSQATAPGSCTRRDSAAPRTQIRHRLACASTPLAYRATHTLRRLARPLAGALSRAALSFCCAYIDTCCIMQCTHTRRGRPARLLAFRSAPRGADRQRRADCSLSARARALSRNNIVRYSARGDVRMEGCIGTLTLATHSHLSAAPLHKQHLACTRLRHLPCCMHKENCLTPRRIFMHCALAFSLLHATHKRELSIRCCSCHAAAPQRKERHCVCAASHMPASLHLARRARANAVSRNRAYRDGRIRNIFSARLLSRDARLASLLLTAHCVRVPLQTRLLRENRAASTLALVRGTALTRRMASWQLLYQRCVAAKATTISCEANSAGAASTGSINAISSTVTRTPYRINNISHHHLAGANLEDGISTLGVALSVRFLFSLAVTDSAYFSFLAHAHARTAPLRARSNGASAASTQTHARAARRLLPRMSCILLSCL